MKIFQPYYFQRISNKFIQGAFIVMMLCFVIGIYYAFWNSPEDYQQGALVRIMYVHVPCAWISIFIYSAMTFFSVIFLIKKIPMLYLFNVASSYVGCMFVALTLITGSIWGKPTWGTWWVWDVRLTSVLILFLFYVSNIIIIHSNKDILRSALPSVSFTIIGFINIPIVKFSVNIWNSLHQKSSLIRFDGPSIDRSMLIPLAIMSLGFIFASLILIAIKTNSLILKIKSQFY